MRRLGFVLLGGFGVLICCGVAWAASEQAMTLRSNSGLSAHAPAESFLAGNFVADEVEPGFVFGTVAGFAKARSCPTAWLMEEGERQRVEAKEPSSGPIEYTLYLEEDCPGKVVHYVFVDRSRANSDQWMEWRKQFHKSKTDPQYGAVKTILDEAARNGFAVSAELRFVVADGELVVKRPEDVLTQELKFQPLYDLKQGKPVAR